MSEKSRSAKICDRILKTVILPKGKNMTDVIMRIRSIKGQKKYNLPLFWKLQENIEGIDAHDMQLFYMNVESQSNSLIIYLHGGAYVSEILPVHWLMLDKITKMVDATFIIPDYPLAPYADYKDCYEKLTVFYKKVLQYYPDRKIILMGDSAGGGLAAGFAMHLKELNLPVPEKLILLSPWIDLVMDNPEIDDYIKNDPLLKKDELRVDAQYWANGTDLRDYRISPTYGDVSALTDVTLFAGTHEFFYPDIVKFKNKLDAAGIPNRIYVGQELDHVYPAFPIPEADEAISIISEIINN